jgi:hypothetical protein
MLGLLLGRYAVVPQGSQRQDLTGLTLYVSVCVL